MGGRARQPLALFLAMVLAGWVPACGDSGGSSSVDSSVGPDGTVNPDGSVDSDGSVPDGGPGPEVWQPPPGTSWQWQLTDLPIDTSFDVDMYDIDLFEVPQATINDLHADGRVVICYFSAGSYEEWRQDATRFPQEALGNPLSGWPGERWLDITHTQVRQIMQDRLELAVTKDCDGVEPDNVDGYTNDPGFSFGYQEQLDYNRFLAAEAHARGLSIGLKNDLDQIQELLSHFDWALNEECFQYNECDLLLPFINAGKTVFQVEYGPASLANTICPQANSLDFDTLIKNWDLDAWRVACR